MSFLSLSNELILVATNRLSIADLSSLRQANRYLYTLLRPLHHKLMLFRASTEGYQPTVKILLENSADACARSSNKVTVLHLAAQHGHEGVASLLLEKGADIDAYAYYDIDIDQYNKPYLGPGDLLWGQEQRVRISPLHLVAGHGHNGIVSLLLEKGAQVDSHCGFIGTSAHEAISTGHVAVTELLLDRGADVAARGVSNRTLLHIAAMHGYKGIACILLQREANIDARCDSNITPLHYAACSRTRKITQLLLLNSADITAQDTNGNTPPHSSRVSTCTNRPASVGARRRYRFSKRTWRNSTPRSIR